MAIQLKPRFVDEPESLPDDARSFVCQLKQSPLKIREQDDTIRAQWLHWNSIFFSSQVSLAAPWSSVGSSTKRRRHSEIYNSEEQVFILNLPSGLWLLVTLSLRLNLAQARNWISTKLKNLVSDEELSLYKRNLKPLQAGHAILFQGFFIGEEKAGDISELQWSAGSRTKTNLNSFGKLYDILSDQLVTTDISVAELYEALELTSTSTKEIVDEGVVEEFVAEEEKAHVHGGSLRLLSNSNASRRCARCEKSVARGDVFALCDVCELDFCLACRAVMICEFSNFQHKEKLRSVINTEDSDCQDLDEQSQVIRKVAKRGHVSAAHIMLDIATDLLDSFQSSDVSDETALKDVEGDRSAAILPISSKRIATKATGITPSEHLEGMLWSHIVNATATFEVRKERYENDRLLLVKNFVVSELSKNQNYADAVKASDSLPIPVIISYCKRLHEENKLPGYETSAKKTVFINRCLKSLSRQVMWTELKKSKKPEDLLSVQDIQSSLSNDTGETCAWCSEKFNPTKVLNTSSFTWRPLNATDEFQLGVDEILLCSDSCSDSFCMQLVCVRCKGSDFVKRNNVFPFVDTENASNVRTCLSYTSPQCTTCESPMVMRTSLFWRYNSSSRMLF